MTSPDSTDGDAIKGWQDQSGNGNNFALTSVGTATAPVRKNAIVNGHPVLRFNGTSNVLLNSTLGPLYASSACNTEFLAADQTAAGVEILHSWETSTSGSDYGDSRIRDNAAALGQTLDRTNNLTDLIPVDGVDPGANFTVMTTSVESRGDAIVGTNGNAGTSAASLPNVSTINQMTLGALVRSTSPNGVLFFGGDVEEVLIYNRELLPSEKTSVATYLKGRVGSTSAPTAPGSLASTGYWAGIRLTWTAVAGGNSYQVQRSPVSAGTWATIGTTLSGVTNYFDTGLAQPSSFDYRVAAVSPGGTVGAYSTLSNQSTTAAGAFTPALLGPCVFWGTPDTLGLTDGTAVASFTDNSGAGNNFTATGAQEPTYHTNVVNGLGCIQYNGTSNYVADDALGSTFNGHQPYAFFELHKLADLTDSDLNGRNYFMLARMSGSSQDTTDFFYFSFGQCLMINPRRDASGAISERSPGGLGIADTNAHLVGTIYDGLYQKHFLDGVTGPAYRTIAAPSFNAMTMGAHRRVDGVNGFDNGYQGECVWYTFAPDANQTAVLWTYEATRYGLSTGVTWDPGQLPDLRQWYRDDTLRNASSVVYSNGNTVSFWWSKTSYGCDLINSGTVTYATNVQNSRPMTAFGGGYETTNGGETNPQSKLILSGGGPFSVFGVFKLASTGAAQTLWSVSNGGSANAYHLIRVTAGGAYGVANQNDAGTAVAGTGGTADTAAHSFLLTFDGKTDTLYVDNAQVATCVQATNLSVATYSKFALGSLLRDVQSEALSGDEGDIAIVTHALTPTERANVYTYEKGRWATP